MQCVSVILFLVHRTCSAVSLNAFSDVQVTLEASSLAAAWSRSLELTSKMSEAFPLTLSSFGMKGQLRSNYGVKYAVDVINVAR